MENSKVDCDISLQNFLENGAYEAFNIKMTNIQKYSKIFIIILILTSLVIIYTTIDEIIAIII